MKFIVASDIHGSAYYAKKLEQIIINEQPDKIILLGDLLYHGPRNELPKEYDPKIVIDILNRYKEKIIAVKGNCDSDVDQMVLEFDIMSDRFYCLIDDSLYLFTHGDKINKDNLKEKVDYLVNGHFHIPAIENYDEFTYLNPGSISLPKEGANNSYIIIDNGEISINYL